MGIATRPYIRALLIVAGSICVGLGALGVFMPLLPTTPFLLLAAAAYLRGSPRFHHWLVNHRILGRYINYYRHGHGMPTTAKIVTIAVLWTTIVTSAIFFASHIAVRILLGVVAIGVTLFVLTRTAPRSRDPGQA